MRRTAFTLLELLIVLAIITTLFGLGYSTFRRQYARTQFKSGVFELQIDLARTRLLAMKTGTPYLFRCAPGSGVYEIAPVATLQETIYRQSGDFGDATESSVGAAVGSLSSVASTGVEDFGNGGFGNGGFSGDGLVATAVSGASSRFSDDLFSPENVAADVAKYRGSTSRSASDVFDASGNVGGGLTTPDDSAAGFALTGAAADSVLSGLDVSPSTTTRDLNAEEKEFATANLLAWRVNGDGAIFRKELSGDVVFTFERVSKSTPSNLKNRRPGGLSTSTGGATSGSENADVGENLGSVWTGSATSLPNSSASFGAGSGSDATASATGDSDSLGVSGGLSAFDGTNAFGAATEPTSLWSAPIVFYPNGRTSTAVLGLACVGDYRFYSEIALRGMTGVARVSSISSLEPGVDPTTSALPQEELFRLTNPGGFSESTGSGSEFGASSGETSGALSGGSLGDVSTESAVGVGNGAFDGATDATDATTAPASSAPAARRSEYRFDAAPNNATAPGGTQSPDASGGGAL